MPAIIIDPKGDITNLLLTFPELRPADFEPWINPDDARRKNMDTGQFAAKTGQACGAKAWPSWDQDRERIARLKSSAEFRIYTPGPRAGEPVSILASLQAPRQGWDGNEEDAARADPRHGQRRCWVWPASTPTRCAVRSTSCFARSSSTSGARARIWIWPT